LRIASCTNVPLLGLLPQGLRGFRHPSRLAPRPRAIRRSAAAHSPPAAPRAAPPWPPPSSRATADPDRSRGSRRAIAGRRADAARADTPHGRRRVAAPRRARQAGTSGDRSSTGASFAQPRKGSPRQLIATGGSLLTSTQGQFSQALRGEAGETIQRAFFAIYGPSILRASAALLDVSSCRAESTHREFGQRRWRDRSRGPFPGPSWHRAARRAYSKGPVRL